MASWHGLGLKAVDLDLLALLCHCATVSLSGGVPSERTDFRVGAKNRKPRLF